VTTSNQERFNSLCAIVRAHHAAHLQANATYAELCRSAAESRRKRKAAADALDAAIAGYVTARTNRRQAESEWREDQQALEGAQARRQSTRANLQHLIEHLR
jgi:hypothetical protein